MAAMLLATVASYRFPSSARAFILSPNTRWTSTASNASTGTYGNPITLTPKNGICMDLDNALKVSIDALKGIAYADDSQVRKITAQRVHGCTAHGGTGTAVVSEANCACSTTRRSFSPRLMDRTSRPSI